VCQDDSGQCACRRGEARGTVGCFLNFVFEIAAEQSNDAHSHQKICRPLEKCCHVHKMPILLAPRNSRPGNWMDLQHRGQSRRVGRSAYRGLIGGAPSVAEVEIVFQVLVRAREQEKATSGG